MTDAWKSVGVDVEKHLIVETWLLILDAEIITNQSIDFYGSIQDNRYCGSHVLCHPSSGKATSKLIGSGAFTLCRLWSLSVAGG